MLLPSGFHCPVGHITASTRVLLILHCMISLAGSCANQAYYIMGIGYAVEPRHYGQISGFLKLCTCKLQCCKVTCCNLLTSWRYSQACGEWRIALLKLHSILRPPTPPMPWTSPQGCPEYRTPSTGQFPAALHNEFRQEAAKY